MRIADTAVGLMSWTDRRAIEGCSLLEERMAEVPQTPPAVRKRLNPFALTLFIVAGLIVLLDGATVFLIKPLLSQSLGRETGMPSDTSGLMFVETAVQLLRQALYSTAYIAALGIVIELTDRILWRLTPEAERRGRKAR
jgi:hypothetical protein